MTSPFIRPHGFSTIFDPFNTSKIDFSQEFLVFLGMKYKEEFEAYEKKRLEILAEEEKKRNEEVSEFDLDLEVEMALGRFKTALDAIVKKQSYKVSRYYFESPKGATSTLIPTHPPYCFKTQETVDAWHRITGTNLDLLHIGSNGVSVTSMPISPLVQSDLATSLKSLDQRLTDVEIFFKQVSKLWRFFVKPDSK